MSLVVLAITMKLAFLYREGCAKGLEPLELDLHLLYFVSSFTKKRTSLKEMNGYNTLFKLTLNIPVMKEKLRKLTNKYNNMLNN